MLNVEWYPLFENEIGEDVLKSGNVVSTSALASCGFWNIDVLITTTRARMINVNGIIDGLGRC